MTSWSWRLGRGPRRGTPPAAGPCSCRPVRSSAATTHHGRARIGGTHRARRAGHQPSGSSGSDGWRRRCSPPAPAGVSRCQGRIAGERCTRRARPDALALHQHALRLRDDLTCPQGPWRRRERCLPHLSQPRSGSTMSRWRRPPPFPGPTGKGRGYASRCSGPRPGGSAPAAATTVWTESRETRPAG